MDAEYRDGKSGEFFKACSGVQQEGRALGDDGCSILVRPDPVPYVIERILRLL
jgi:hypothetical protein